MGVKTYSDSGNKSQVKYNFVRKAGRSIIEGVPLFSPDGESLLVVVENIVRVYNIQTGDCARTLETETPVDELVSIQFPDNENYNLYGCSDGGTITTWTWDNGAVLREIKLSLPSDIKKVLTFNLTDNNECFITAQRKSIHLHLGVYSIKTGELIYEFSEIKVKYYESLTRVSIGCCNFDRFAAITNGTAILCIQNLNKPHQNFMHRNMNNIRFLTVAAHKTQSAVVVTDALGRATIYRGNLFQQDVGRENLHWHFLPAIAACFSAHGSYLYTGGMERVLVKWTVGNLANRAHEKMLIPRLPGFVRFLAADNNHVAATLSNNSIVIANAQMQVVSTILECGGLSPVARAYVTPLPLVYHARLGGLLMGGRTGHLQLYSTTTDKVLYNIDITGMNNTPPERHNLLPIETEVTCAAVSGNSSWLVTSEYRNDGVSYSEERLKFWELQIKNTTPFKLNTCVNLSHGGCNVVAIALSIEAHFCVSAGSDQKFRIWKKETNKRWGRKTTSWNCVTACYYSSGIAQFLGHDILNEYKIGQMPPGKGEEHPYLRLVGGNDVIKKLMNVHKDNGLVDERSVNAGMRNDLENDMGGVAISQDGSLIAAWFGCKLTLWDTHLCNLRTTLSHPAMRPKGVDVKFGSHDAAHYLVCTTQNCLVVWSLLSLTVKWMVQINPTCLAVDPMTNKMAVVTSNNDVIVFTPHSSKPILTQKRLLSPQSGVIKQCTFGAHTGAEDIRLYFMRNDSEIYSLEPEQSNEDRLEVISRRSLPVSNFSALLAETQLSEVKPAASGPVQQLDTNALSNTAIAQFLSAAPHMVPPVSLLCTSFLLHISGQEEEAPQDIKEEDPGDQESSSEDEEETKNKLNGPYAPKDTQLWTPNYKQVKEKRLQRILNEQLLDLHATESIFGV